MFPPKLKIVQRSLVEHEGVEFALVQGKAAQQVAVLAAPGAPILADLEGQTSDHEGKSLLQGPLSPRNAAALRTHLPWLKPRPLGLQTSAGMGDRLGLATPGHVRAVRAAGGSIAPSSPSSPSAR